MNRPLTDLIDHVVQLFVDQQKNKPKTLIVGFSGGIDSVALLHSAFAYCKQYELQLVAAHFHHQWREQAGADAQWCQHFATTIGAIYEQGQRDQYEPTIAYKGSLEAHGRAMRRAFFMKLHQHYEGAPILLAHHQDDQRETFFIRLIRGATVEGLKGMKVIDGFYLRPFLSIEKKELALYGLEQGLSYREDDTNTDPRFLRNRIRHSLLPLLAQIDQRSLHQLSRVMNNLAAVDLCVEKQVEKLYREITVDDSTGKRRAIQKSLFLVQEPYLQHRLLIRWLIEAKMPFTPQESFLQEICRFFQTSKSSTHCLRPGWSIQKKKELILLQQQ